MMNYIWTIMMCFGLLFAFLNGKLDAFTTGLMESCSEAVQFVISLTGIMAVWGGLMNIAEESGLIRIIAKKTKPLIHFLFPHEKNSQTISMILMSFITNLFGAGNSATVFSLKAMELLDKENNHSPVASNAMCMFMAVNMSMLQLVPITVMQIRNDLGSVDSGSIIVPSIVSGLISMAVSIVLCKFIERKSGYE